MPNSTTTLIMDNPFIVTPAAILLRALTLTTLVLDLPPLIWHIRSRNLTASTLVFYIMLQNFFTFINTLIWPTDDINNWWPGHGLCDIEVKLMQATSLGVVSCLVCMLRDLAQVLNTERTVLSLSDAQRRRQLVIDCLLCFGAPVYMMVAHYVVQSNRYYIFAIAGCNAGFDPSWPSVALVWVWPPTFCLISCYYAVLLIIRTIRYKRTFSAILASSSSSLTKSRFIRLFAMAFTMILVIFPVACYILFQNAAAMVVPYSWSRVHGPGFKEIMMVPAYGVVSFDRWIQAGAGFLVFIFFGMGRDAMKGYRKGLLMVGLGRVFPSLKGKGDGGRGESLGSQGSGASRKELMFENGKKFANRFSRKYESSLPTYSPASLFTSSNRSPNPTMNKAGYPANIPELEGRLSGSTAPSTPYSTEKYLATTNSQKVTWFKRCLIIIGIIRGERVPSSDSGTTRV